MIAEILAGAFINRLRGDRFGEVLPSTQASRLLAALLFTLVAAPQIELVPLVILTCAFWVYMVPGWDFTVFIKHMEIPSIQFKPADYIMKKIKFPCRNFLEQQLWGALAMSIRQSLIILPMVTLWALYGGNNYLLLCPAILLMGFAYPVCFWLADKLNKSQHRVMFSEWLAGGAIGWMLGN